jgi:hypothetical protein
VILWELGEKQLKVEGWKVWRLRRGDKERELHAETVSAHREERSGEGEGDWMECDESMG